LPRELFDRLAQAAGEKGISTEIRDRLEASFGGVPNVEDPVFRDALTAIGHAASSAAKMRCDGGFVPYVAFEVAAGILIEAFRPYGAPAQTKENWWQGIATASAAVMQTAGKSGEAFFRVLEITRRKAEELK
jgi:hypothetical protein